MVLELGRAGYSRLVAVAGEPVPLVRETFPHDEVAERLLERVRRLPSPFQRIVEVAREGTMVSVTLERFIGVDGEAVIARLREVDRLLPLNVWSALAREWLAVVKAQADGVSSPSSVGVDLQGRVVLTAGAFNYAVGALPERDHPQLVVFQKTLSPEHVQGLTLREASRVYSVAASLVRLLTAEALFAGTGVALLRGILQGDARWTPHRHPEVDERLAAVLTRAIARDPAARFPTIDAFAQTLTGVLPPSASVVEGVAGLCAPAFRAAVRSLADTPYLPSAWRSGGLAVQEDKLLERARPVAELPVPTCAPAG